MDRRHGGPHSTATAARDPPLHRLRAVSLRFRKTTGGRTIRALKEQGRIPGIVERFNPHVGPHGIRQDLFGFIDIIALCPDHGIVAVQSCGQDFAGHVRKMTEERNEAMFEWLKHARVELFGWRKVKLKRGGKAVSEQSKDVARLDDHRFERAMKVLRTAGYQDVADECSAHRSFSVAARDMLDGHAAKSGKDKTDE